MKQPTPEELARFPVIDDARFPEAFETLIGERPIPLDRKTEDVRRQALAVVREVLDQVRLRQ